MTRRVVFIALGAVALAGCGGDDAEKTTAAPAAKAGPPPAELQGTYKVRLKPSELPKSTPTSPPVLKPDAEPYDWRVEIAATGGPGNSPTLTIVHPTRGTLESSTMTVTGNSFRLTDEDCASPAGHSLVSTTFRWAVIGPALRLTKVSGGCPDKVAETILTSRPLTKVAG